MPWLAISGSTTLRIFGTVHRSVLVPFWGRVRQALARERRICRHRHPRFQLIRGPNPNLRRSGHSFTMKAFPCSCGRLERSKKTILDLATDQTMHLHRLAKSMLRCEEGTSWWCWNICWGRALIRFLRGSCLRMIVTAPCHLTLTMPSLILRPTAAETKALIRRQTCLGCWISAPILQVEHGALSPRPPCRCLTWSSGQETQETGSAYALGQGLRGPVSLLRPFPRRRIPTAMWKAITASYRSVHQRLQACQSTSFEALINITAEWANLDVVCDRITRAC